MNICTTKILPDLDPLGYTGLGLKRLVELEKLLNFRFDMLRNVIYIRHRQSSGFLGDDSNQLGITPLLILHIHHPDEAALGNGPCEIRV